jgi:hypothetical protein
MNPLLILGGAILIGLGIMPKKELTKAEKDDTVKSDNAKGVPEPEIDDNEKTNLDNSDSESGGVDTV